MAGRPIWPLIISFGEARRMMSRAALLSLATRPCTSRTGLAISLRLVSPLPREARNFSSTLSRREEKSKQPQTPATDHIELSSPVTYISNSTDPWFNLSYEDWLLRQTPHHQPVLFLYRNQPCVVIGRNQNPWKETNPRKLREWGIPLVRRRSGGGTVYHDMGNTNFSIILPRLLFTRAHGAELVARAIRDKLGIAQCTVNSRNDVIIRDGTRELKVSGSAYKIIQHRAYHHGTMLLSSDVATLGRTLRSGSPNMETKGIASFRSPVTTLSAYSPQTITHAAFTEAVVGEFERVYTLGEAMPVHHVDEGQVKEAKVWDGAAEMKTWEWEHGQTPEFTNTIEGTLSFGDLSVSLAARHAVLTSLTFHVSPGLATSLPETREVQGFLDALALSLVGQRYESLDSACPPTDPHWRGGNWAALAEEVITWFRNSM